VIKKILQDYLYGSFPEEFTDDMRSGLRRRATIINSFTPFAIVLCIVYGYIAFNNPMTVWIGFVILATLVAVLISIPYVRRTKNVTLAAHILVAVAIPIQLSYLITGGPLGHGFFWAVAWVPWAFLLLGRKKAIIWVGVLIISSLALLLFDNLDIASIAYTFPEVIQIIFMLFIASVLLFIYEQQAEFFEKLSYRALDALIIEKKKSQPKKAQKSQKSR